MQKKSLGKVAIALATSASLAFAVAAPAAHAATKKVTVGIAYDLGGRSQPGFNQLAYIGYTDYLKKHPGAAVKESQASASDTDATRTARLKLMVQAGANPIVAVGFNYENALKTVAPLYPKVKFAIVDDNAIVAPNVEGLNFKAEQGSYLVGAIAALMSKTGHVGYIGGVKVPLLQAFEAGFTAGVHKIKATDVVDVTYITNPPDFGGFNAPDKGHEAALGMYQNGADIVYAAAGGTGAGVHLAAHEQGKWSIGVDADEATYASNIANGAATAILTSALKNVNVGVASFLTDVATGKFKGQNKYFDLANGGVGFSLTGSHIPAAVVKQVNALGKQIAAGTIVVPTDPTKA